MRFLQKAPGVNGLKESLQANRIRPDQSSRVLAFSKTIKTDTEIYPGNTFIRPNFSESTNSFFFTLKLRVLDCSFVFSVFGCSNPAWKTL